MRILRLLLILSLLMVAYSVGVCVYLYLNAWFAIVPLFLLMSASAKKGAALWVMGTARWADYRDIPNFLSGGNGLGVGVMEGKPSKVEGVNALFNRRLPAAFAVWMFLASSRKRSPKLLVRLNTAVHTICVAPTGVGKSSGLVIPFLLSNTDSCVALDFSGELASKTADTRRKMGHRVVLLDPFRVVTQTPDGFNPIPFIQQSKAITDGRDIGEALVIKTAEDKEPYWNKSAEVWISAMVSAIAHFAPDELKSLQSVRNVLSNPERTQATIQMMCDSKDVLIARIGHELKHYQNKTLDNVLTVVNSHLNFLDSPEIMGSTTGQSFNPADLTKGKTTVFIVLPPEHIRANTGWLRLIINSMLRGCVANGGTESTPVHFIIDEAATLGHMDAIDDAVDKYRKYGVKLQLYYQSLGQIRKCFPDGQDQTLLSNVSKVFFGVNDQMTAEGVSALLGEHTVIVHSGRSGDGTSSQHTSGQNPSSSSSTSHNVNRNWNQHGRKLLKPEEIIALDQRVAITLTPGAPPLWTRLVRYYEKQPRSAGTWRAVLDTASLFLAGLLLAALWTGILFKG